MSDPSFYGCREPDYFRQAQELEEERLDLLLSVLSRCPKPEAAILASELGISDEWRKYRMEVTHAENERND